MPPFYILLLEAFIFGLVIGSFLNVCIYRLPQEMTLGGRSFCPHCKQKVFWYDNIPLFGYLFLGGECRQCQKPISVRYPAVELMTGILSVMTLYRTGTLPEYFLWFLLFAAPLIVVVFIDFDHKIIPDIISIPGIGVGFLVIFYCKWPFWGEALSYSFFGTLVGGGSLFLMGSVYQWIRKREGLGGGDVKLCAMLGAFLGWQGMLLVFFVGSIAGSFYSLFLILMIKMSQKGVLKKNEGPLMIPFGPFLVFGALVYFFFGNSILDFYSSLSGISFSNTLGHIL